MTELPKLRKSPELPKFERRCAPGYAPACGSEEGIFSSPYPALIPRRVLRAYGIVPGYSHSRLTALGLSKL